MSAKTNYSFETSLPAFKDNLANNKIRQCDEVLSLIKRGAKCLLQISEISKIPQAVISARMSDLMKEGKAGYDGQIVFKDRLRKKIVVLHPPVIQIGKQQNLF